MKFEIKQRFTGVVLYEGEAEILAALVARAVASRAELRGADLRGADLSGAELYGADLRGADLSGADLYGADLSGANLRGADLSDADLRRADLGGANLRGADLRRADLYGADLSGANLRGADLSDADLRIVRDDIWAVLSSAPAEVQGLRDALANGLVDGSTYQGDCACLVGTIAKVRHCAYDEIPALKPDSSRPAERFFFAINEGDTPETSQACKLAIEWVDEWLGNMRAAFGVNA